jgi:heat-inducible transcriptional repressor
MLEDRRSDVLRAVVEEHIHTGEPVSSRSILHRTQMSVSTATVRNDLAFLEREGFLVQPHTSAGRVPTARAYRYYVDHITRGKLAPAAQNRIAGFFSSVQMELSKLLRATSQLLAEVTHYPAVVIGPPSAKVTVRAVHLVQLAPELVLVVVVTDRGRVLQEQCRFDAPLDLADVADSEQVLSRLLVGRELSAAIPDEAAIANDAVGRIVERVMVSVARAAEGLGDVYVGGTGQMTAVWDNLNAVHRVLEVLETEAQILHLLADASGTSIKIGEELGVADQVDMAVVSATFDAGGSEGSIGVIGPMRMDYKKAISAVEEVGRELEDRIST